MCGTAYVPHTSSANGRLPCGRTLGHIIPQYLQKETLGIQGFMTRKFEFYMFVMVFEVQV